MTHEPDFVPPAADVIAGIMDALGRSSVQVGERHPITRTGEREPLSRVLRWLIWHRDRGRCQMCGNGNVLMELDHVIPWSASGPDVATNLRILCGRCNKDRSNYRTFDMTELLPVTAICDRCINGHENLPSYHWEYGFCPICKHEPVNQFTHADAVDHVAYCGCCRRRSTVTDPGRLL